MLPNHGATGRLRRAGHAGGRGVQPRPRAPFAHPGRRLGHRGHRKRARRARSASRCGPGVGARARAALRRAGRVGRPRATGAGAGGTLGSPRRRAALAFPSAPRCALPRRPCVHFGRRRVDAPGRARWLGHDQQARRPASGALGRCDRRADGRPRAVGALFRSARRAHLGARHRSRGCNSGDDQPFADRYRTFRFAARSADELELTANPRPSRRAANLSPGPQGVPIHRARSSS